ESLPRRDIPAAERLGIMADNLLLAAERPRQQGAIRGGLAGTLPDHLARPRIEGNQRGVLAAGVDDQPVIDDKRRGARAPFALVAGSEGVADLHVPDGFARLQLDAVEMAERAEEKADIAVDQGSGAWGVAVVELAW